MAPMQTGAISIWHSNQIDYTIHRFVDQYWCDVFNALAFMASKLIDSSLPARVCPRGAKPDENNNNDNNTKINVDFICVSINLWFRLSASAMHSPAFNFLKWSVGEPKPIITGSRSVNYSITCAWWTAMTDVSSVLSLWLEVLSPLFLFSLSAVDINHFSTIFSSAAQCFRWPHSRWQTIIFTRTTLPMMIIAISFVNVIGTARLHNWLSRHYDSQFPCREWLVCAFNPFAICIAIADNGSQALSPNNFRSIKSRSSEKARNQNIK